jgi:hypothetical protein
MLVHMSLVFIGQTELYVLKPENALSVDEVDVEDLHRYL